MEVSQAAMRHGDEVQEVLVSVCVRSRLGDDEATFDGPSMQITTLTLITNRASVDQSRHTPYMYLVV